MKYLRIAAVLLALLVGLSLLMSLEDDDEPTRMDGPRTWQDDGATERPIYQSQSEPNEGLPDSAVSMSPSSLSVDSAKLDYVDLRPLGVHADLLASASNGDVEAAYDLYRIYASCTRNETPEGCRPNEVEAEDAIQWLKVAADAEHLPAQTEYYKALVYYKGTLTEAEQRSSLRHLRSAAERGSADAMYWLALLSTSGLDFSKTYESHTRSSGLSRVEAYSYYLAAASVYDAFNIRNAVTEGATGANVQFSPAEESEAYRRAQAILDSEHCCKVWKFSD